MQTSLSQISACHQMESYLFLCYDTMKNLCIKKFKWNILIQEMYYWNSLKNKLQAISLKKKKNQRTSQWLVMETQQSSAGSDCIVLGKEIGLRGKRSYGRKSIGRNFICLCLADKRFRQAGSIHIFAEPISAAPCDLEACLRRSKQKQFWFAGEKNVNGTWSVK